MDEYQNYILSGSDNQSTSSRGSSSSGGGGNDFLLGMVFCIVLGIVFAVILYVHVRT